MKNNEMMEVCGAYFTYKNKLEVSDAAGWDLYDCYGNPSYRKIRVWESWKKWLDEFYNRGGEGYLYISGYNSCNFTIGGRITWEDRTFKIKITKENHYISEI